MGTCCKYAQTCGRSSGLAYSWAAQRQLSGRLEKAGAVKDHVPLIADVDL